MNIKTLWGPLAAALLAVAVGAGLWHRQHDAVAEARAELVAATLVPVVALLRENQALVAELQQEPFSEPDVGILSAYLAKIRRDGVPRHAAMQQRLDQLADNNTTIVALLKAYAPYAKTAALTAATDKYRNYAAAWRDRWSSVLELFMAGGNYPAADLSAPAELPVAVQAEIAATR
jgi:hypothetical protein